MARRDRWVELWGIMGNYGELWGIMGNYGSTMGNYWELWGNFGSSMGNYGEIWTIMGNYGELWGIMGFYGAVGTLRDRRVHKPHVHRAWGLLSALRARINSYTTDFGPATESLPKKETDGRRWYTAGNRESLKAVLNAAVQKSDNYLGLLAYAKSARVFDPRQREQLPKEIENYVAADKVQRVVPGNMAATLATEWELYWTLPAVPAQLDVMAWWRGMKSHLPEMATLAIRTLSIPHTAADVERCGSFYKLTRTDKQHSLGDAHHLRRLSFVMNGIVPPPMGV